MIEIGVILKELVAQPDTQSPEIDQMSTFDKIRAQLIVDVLEIRK